MWLQADDALPLVLVEASVQVAGVETIRYLANGIYITGPADVPANTAYEPIISAPPQIVERLSTDGQGSLSAGDIELDNTEGERDGWLMDVWRNRPLRAWIGDVRWPRADFRLIFDGITADIDSSDRSKLNLKLRDKLQRLNTALTEAKLAGATENKDALLPVLVGECHNVAPLLADPVTQKYQLHAGAIERIIEVRDNGKPVPFVGDLAAGKFTLQAQPAGTVTVSAQGDRAATVYRNTVAKLIERLATGYGKAADRFSAGDIDAVNFAAFDAAHPQPVGYYATDRENVLAVCQYLASSIGAQLVPSRAGLLRLIALQIPAPGMPIEINESHMVAGSLRPAERLDVLAAVKVGFCKCWSVQADLVTSIPTEHKDLYATEWLTETVTDAATLDRYRLTAEPEQRDTALLRRVDARAEAQRELDLRKVQRTVYEFEATAELLMAELGAAVRLVSSRYGMAAGVPGMVVSVAPNWLTRRNKIEVLV
ncbi:MAG TPA: hypothetical protein VF774_12215 [Pseudoduganella sp.]